MLTVTPVVVVVTTTWIGRAAVMQRRHVGRGRSPRQRVRLRSGARRHPDEVGRGVLRVLVGVEGDSDSAVPRKAQASTVCPEHRLGRAAFNKAKVSPSAPSRSPTRRRRWPSHRPRAPRSGSRPGPPHSPPCCVSVSCRCGGERRRAPPPPCPTTSTPRPSGSARWCSHATGATKTRDSRLTTRLPPERRARPFRTAMCGPRRQLAGVFSGRRASHRRDASPSAGPVSSRRRPPRRHSFTFPEVEHGMPSKGPTAA